MKILTGCLLLLTTVSPLCAQDLLRFKDPKKQPDLEGEVVTLTFKLIEIQAQGVRQPVDARAVADLSPLRKTFEFTKGEEALANHDLPTAVQRFNRVIADPAAGELQRQTAAITIVRAHATIGRPADVLATAQALRQKMPMSFFTLESYQREIRAQLDLKNQAGAKAAIGGLAALALVHAMPGWAKSADLLDAEVLEQLPNWRGALAIYRKHARDVEFSDEAALGELRCLTAIADFPGLRLRADGIIQDSQGKASFNSRLLIAAYTGRGDVEANGGKPKEALLAYLQGAIVLTQGELGREHETALARGALTLVKISRTETDPAAKARARARSQELLLDLKRLFPESPYIKEIEQALR
jgi:hypothetical protein